MIWFGLVGFCGISSIVGYLKPNHVFTCILTIFFVNTYTQLNNQTVLFLTIQFSIRHLFAYNLDVKQFHQMLLLWARVDLGVMAMKGYSNLEGSE